METTQVSRVKIVRRIPFEVLFKRPLESERKDVLKEERLHQWTVRTAIKRPFIKVKWQDFFEEEKKLFFQAYGKKATRKQRRQLRRKAAVAVARKYQHDQY